MPLLLTHTYSYHGPTIPKSVGIFKTAKLAQAYLRSRVTLKFPQREFVPHPFLKNATITKAKPCVYVDDEIHHTWRLEEVPLFQCEEDFPTQVDALTTGGVTAHYAFYGGKTIIEKHTLADGREIAFVDDHGQE